PGDQQPHGSAPNYGQPPYGVPGYGQQPYAQQPYGMAPVAGYGPPPHGAAPTAQRPGLATAAGVMAIISGIGGMLNSGLSLIGALGVYGMTSRLNLPGFGMVIFILVTLAAVGLAIGVIMLTGGFQLLNKAKTKVLFIACASQIGLTLVSFASSFYVAEYLRNSTGTSTSTSILAVAFGLVYVGLIVYFIQTPQVKNWIASRN
ncbi:MAG: hypothetical protein Q3997_08035, partial [Propionibacteriaceae bacterium]|nr:hypothetical protein [Propionibacteriaceae bacterium]